VKGEGRAEPQEVGAKCRLPSICERFITFSGGHAEWVVPYGREPHITTTAKKRTDGNPSVSENFAPTSSPTKSI